MLISHYLSKDLLHQSKLSSPRAESARAVTGRLQQDQEFLIPGFPGWDFAKSQDPGIFRDRISLKFYPRIIPKWGLSEFPYQLINLVNFIHFVGVNCL